MSLFIAESGLVLLGWFIGFLIAMPVGPVAVLAVKRTLKSGWPLGVAVGLGATSADTVYAAIAAFGIYAVQDFLLHHQYTLRLIGGLVLLAVGLRMLVQKPHVEIPPAADAPEIAEDAWHKLAHNYATGLILTLTNPLTLAAFITIFTNFGLSEDMHTYKNALVFVAGAFLGAATWWLSLVGGMSLIKARLSDTLVAKINSVLAVILVLVAVYAILTGLLERPLLKLNLWTTAHHAAT